MYHSFKAAVARCIYSCLPKRRQSHASEEAVTCSYGRSPITNTCNACERDEYSARTASSTTCRGDIDQQHLGRISTVKVNLTSEPHSGELSCQL